jgi:hypothetical protein
MNLIPTEYKIEHTLNEHFYYIIRRMSNKYNYKWFVTIIHRNQYLVEEYMGWSDFACDKYGYDTPEDALEAWERYVKN